MSRQYSLPTVSRMVTNDLWEQFFVQLENPCWSMDWSRRPRRNVVSILQCLDYFEERQKDAAELILQQVFHLACRQGSQAMRDSIKLLQPELLPQLPTSMNLYCQAMWLWLNAPEVFEHAVLFLDLDARGWWSKRDDLPRAQPQTDPEALNWLADDVGRLLEAHEGRGRQCTIEHVTRDGDLDYFFCFPDDHVQTVMLHNRAGKLVTRTLRKTFEIVFVYSRRDGTLELSAQLKKSLKEQLEESFAWLILDAQVGPRERKQIYNLNRLKDQAFRLSTDPADRVWARVRRLKLDLPDLSQSVTLESKKGPDDAMQRMVDDVLNQERVSLDELHITQVQFHLQFAGTTQRRRGSMMFDVAHPDRCNLRRHDPDRVAVAEKCLRLWRLVQ